MCIYYDWIFKFFIFILVFSVTILMILRYDITYDLEKTYKDIYKKFISGTKKSILDSSHFYGLSQRKLQIHIYIFKNRYDLNKIMPISQKIYSLNVYIFFIFLFGLLLAIFSRTFVCS